MKIEKNKEAYLKKYSDQTESFPLPFDDDLFSFGSVGVKRRSSNIAEEMKVFQTLKEHGMFGMVTEEFADELAKYLEGKKVLEVMAGAGYLAHELHTRGVDIIATDDYSWGIRPYNDFPIEALDAAEAVKKYSNVDYILVSWIPMGKPATSFIKAVKEYCSDTPILHIGEGGGGCTGNDYFFDNVIEIDDENLYPAQRKFENFFGVHDHLVLMKCKK